MFESIGMPESMAILVLGVALFVAKRVPDLGEALGRWNSQLPRGRDGRWLEKRIAFTLEEHWKRDRESSLPRSLFVHRRSPRSVFHVPIPDTSGLRSAILTSYVSATSPMAQQMPIDRAPTVPMKSSDTPRILIADDQPDVLEALRFLVKGEGYQSETVNSPAAAIDSVESRDFDAVLMDLNYTRDTTSGQEGLELLNRIQTLDTTLPVIVMTAWGSVELAVEAMRRGARDFIQKPWDNARLSAILKTQIELGRALRKGQRLEAENRALRAERFPQLIAQSAAMRPVLDVISRVGPSDANVLITGENGTGKGLVAQTLHSVSLRSTRPLVTVNTGGLAEGVFESELFGHVKGAFTDAKVDRVGRFEMADGGTLFLDEIANISQGLQSKLLRTLETGEFERVGSSKTRRVDVRVFSATNADLNAAVAESRFRQDLLFRLNTIEIRLPPLRDRREDIPLLAAHFLHQHSSHYRKSHHRLRRERGQSAAGALVARQRARARSCRGARRADGAERDHSRRRSGSTRRPRRSAAAGRDESGRRGSAAHQEGAGAFQWKREPCRQRARLEPQRALSPAATIWTIAALRVVADRSHEPPHQIRPRGI